VSEDVTRYGDLLRRERSGTGFAFAFLALAVCLVLVTALVSAFTSGGGMWAARLSVAALALALGYHLVRTGWDWWRQGSTSRSRVDRVRSRARTWLDFLVFYGLVWAYTGLLGGLVAVTGLGRDANGLVRFALMAGCFAAAYQLAVQTVGWWRRRQARQG